MNETIYTCDFDSSKLKGMEELWDMLRDLCNDYSCTVLEKYFDEKYGMNRIINEYDVKEFVEKYNLWKEAEQRQFNGMRDYLHRFCVERICPGCPLHTPEFKCGRGFGFKCGPDSIPDEELQGYYEKAKFSSRNFKT